MTVRFVQSEHDRAMLLRFIEQHKLPFSATLQTGHKRSDRQNRLQRQWVNEIADQLTDQTAEEWRGYCKLHFGVPIRRNDDEAFREAYDKVIRPLPYEAKLLAMMVPLDFPVTRDMNSKQKTQYLDDVWRHFSEHGVVLTDPERSGFMEREMA